VEGGDPGQKYKISREARLRLLSIAFAILMELAARKEQTDLLEMGADNLKVFLFRDMDLNKLAVSIATLARILMLPIINANISQIGTANLEHLFGMARLGTRGDNSPSKIFRRLVKSHLCARISECTKIRVTRKRERNIAGTTDSGTDGDDISEFDECSPAAFALRCFEGT
jgi:hypothetical protein